MHINFLGVGEACDPDYPNTSVLVDVSRAGDLSRHVLLDCGFTTPHLYFRTVGPQAADTLTALWISHFHGDHFLGVPLLLLRFWETGRRSPLTIAGPKGISEKVEQSLALAYPSLAGQLPFPLRYVEFEPGRPYKAEGIHWRCASSDHSPPALALRLDINDQSVFYSGDGRSTAGTLKLARGCSLVIHEAYRLSGETPGHGTVAGSMEFARLSGAKRLALVHIQQQERRTLAVRKSELLTQEKELEVLLPEPGEIVKLVQPLSRVP